ncbi:Glucose dehydrogenase [FAD, quinone] [Trichinella zimbabwensis]|uniref:Glucose dehydrogenase [FAD, quinone] n=2 Tax=Trichinella TaxID=6333 RepID=A0A0V1N183_9BILA|nr:Glucose dehydrogenase [FAD, quinone] [Trichinella zimbabwensis]KRZ77600.1 Glucose dehydrogenase [FAD, quinone] [Trichinella papuae]
MLTTLLTLASLYSTKLSQYPHEMFPDVTENLHRRLDEIFAKPFDFVIVGSGYSGSLLARRLAAGGCERVLVIEAGGSPHFDSAVPFVNLGNKSNVEWNYLTTAQKKAAQEMINQKVHLHVAKALGGRSILSSGAYVPANPDDFIRWAESTGFTDWSDIDRYMFKLSNIDETDLAKSPITEKQLMNIIFKDSGMQVLDPLKLLWLHAGRASNHTVAENENELFEKGGFFIPRTLSFQGTKLNPAAVYLGRAKQNLVVVCHTEAIKLTQRTGQSFAISGIQVRDMLSGRLYNVRVRREIILAAGAIGTAKLLIQSGVGPMDHLKQLKIPAIKSLPVGVRLYDRVKVSLPVKISNVAMKALIGQIDSKQTLKEYLTTGKGLLANTSVIGMAFLDTDKSGSPDVMLELKPAALTGLKRMMEDENFKSEVEKILDPSGELQNTVYLDMVITLLRPMSQGTMWLWRQSENNFVPRMNPSYLTDYRDVRKMIKAVKMVENMMQTPIMKQVGAVLLYPNIPKCSAATMPASEYYIECLLRHLATTGDHLTSTAALGEVVDDELRVKTIRGVRVVDESVFPSTVTGGIGATLLALANRAADMIKEQHDLKC